MRTRSADEDLVVVDLDDPDELERRGPGAQWQHFEDHYAELPFGLGTVPRRLEPDPWYSRPGLILFVAIALMGLVALAGSGDGSEEANRSDPGVTPPFVPTELAPFGVRTGIHLALYHVGNWSDLDIDRTTVRPLPPTRLPPSLASLPDGANVLGALPSAPTRNIDHRGRTMCLSRGAVLRARFQPGECAPTEETVSDLGGLGAASRDGRFFFVAAAGELLVIDALSDGIVRRVDMQLPPFEAMFVL